MSLEQPLHLRESKLARLYWEDFEVGDVFHAPWGRTMTDAYLLAFAGMNSDFQHMHVDEIYSQATPFGGRIAHGNLTAAQGMGMQVYTQVFHHALALLEEQGAPLTKPIVCRIDGNNAIEGRRILKDANHPLIEIVDTMDDAARRVAELAAVRKAGK